MIFISKVIYEYTQEQIRYGFESHNQLIIEKETDYMKIQSKCAVCSERLRPGEVLEDVTYSINAKFICMREKNIIVCDCCYEEIQRAFPGQMA